MSLTMMAIGAGLGGLNAYFGNRAMAEAQREQIELQRLASIYQYKATEDSINIMKGLNREATMNAINEALRAGTEDVRRASLAVDKAAGSLQAQSEGITAGQSKGRQMATMYLKGSQMVEETKDQTSSVISQLIEKQDMNTAQLNNQLLQAHQQMAAVLANEGPSHPGQANRFISGALSGAQLGLSWSSLGNSTPSAILPSNRSNPPVVLGNDNLYDSIRIPSGINFNW